MRVSLKFLLAAALCVPAGMVVTSATGAGAAGGTTCAATAGTATFKPPLPVSGSSTKVKPKVTAKNGKATKCSGGGVKSGKFTSISKFHTATNCDTLLSGAPSPKPPTGTITTTWNTGDKSSGTVTLQPVSGQPTQTHITGKVTSGLFSGLTLNATISFTPKTGDCITAPLSAVTFKQVSALTIS